MAGVRRFATFRLADLFFGVDVFDVQEVIRHQRTTRVPLAPPAVRGLMNLRGEIVPALDLRERFGLPPRPSDALPTNVVVRTADGATSLLVDEIGDVLEASEDAFEPPPPTVTGVARDLVGGVYKLKDRLMLVLDVAKTVDPSATSEGSCGTETRRVPVDNAERKAP